MNENEKDEALTEAEEELSESIDSLVEDLNERAENDEDPDNSDEDPDNSDFSPDEDEFDEEEDEFSEEDSDEDKDGDEDADVPDDSNNEDPAPEPQPEPPKVSESDRKYNAMVKQARKALKSMGVEVENDEDVLTELERINAEAEGKTLEEYQKDVSEEENSATSREDRYRADLEAIQKAYPSAKAYKHLRELPNVKRFVELMNTGKMSAVEAFKLSHPNEADEAIVKSVKQSTLNDTKSHLKSNVLKKSGGERSLSMKEMREYKDMFPDLSTKEIEDLYRRTSH
jgi:hypothetical protein